MRVDELEEQLVRNSDMTQANSVMIEKIQKNTDEIVEFFTAGKGFFTVAKYVGVIAKWVTTIAAAGALLWWWNKGK